MRKRKLWLLVLLLSACDSHEAPKTAASAPQQPGLFDAQRQTLERARQINQKTEQNTEQQQQAVDQQTR